MKHALGIASALLPGLLVAAGPGKAPETCRYSRTLKTSSDSVTVSIPDGEGCLEGTIRITVKGPGEVNQEFELPRSGKVWGTWGADITRDGLPEVVIATREAGAAGVGHVQVVHKVGVYYKPRVLSEVDARKVEGYRGGDTFNVKKGTLYRTFPLYATSDRDDAPSLGTASYRWNAKGDFWARVKPEPSPTAAPAATPTPTPVP